MLEVERFSVEVNDTVFVTASAPIARQDDFDFLFYQEDTENAESTPLKLIHYHAYGLGLRR